MEEFEALLNDSLEIDTPNEGSVVKGKVIAIEAGQAIIDLTWTETPAGAAPVVTTIYGALPVTQDEPEPVDILDVSIHRIVRPVPVPPEACTHAGTSKARHELDPLAHS